mgnify:CR=1 FL=1
MLFYNAISIKNDWTLIKVSKEMYLIFSGGKDAQFRD